MTRQVVEEIKNRLKISELISKDTKLTRKANRVFAICPFHSEKSPSLTVDDDRGFYHCFGCGVSGDHFSYVQERMKLSFPQALEYLANLAQVELPAFSPKEAEQKSHKQILYKILEDALSWYKDRFQKSEGEAARNYIDNRAITPAMQKQFQIAFVPKGAGLLAHLKQTYNDKILAQTGIFSGDENKLKERFYERILFPIQDNIGRVVAFGGRALGENFPKYLNSSESEIFHKKSILYGLHFAKKNFKEAPIVVEGYIDVIRLHQAGIARAVAPMGTALTTDHLKILWNYHPKPVMCFDGDKAGRIASERALKNMLPMLTAKTSARFLFLPAGEDPDSFIASNGASVFESLLEKAHSFADTMWHMALNQHELLAHEDRLLMWQEVQDLLKQIPQQQLQDAFFRDFKQRFYELNSSYYRKNSQNSFDKRKFNNKFSKSNVSINFKKNVGPAKRPELDLMLMLTLHKYPEIADDVIEDLMDIQFKDTDLENLRQKVVSSEKLSEKDVNWLDQKLQDPLTYMYAPFLKEDVSEKKVKENWKNIWKKIKLTPSLFHDVSDRLKTFRQNQTEEAWQGYKTMKTVTIQKDKNS